MKKKLSLISIVLSLLLGLQIVPQSLLAMNSDTSVPSTLQTEAVNSYWPSHRGNNDNNGIVDIAENTPVLSSETELVWAEDFVTSGFSAASQGIIVNNELVFVAMNYLYAVNPNTGETIRRLELPANLGFAATPPLYAEGRIFIPLNSSRLVSFPYSNWDTQTSVEEIPGSWSYQDEVTGLQVQTALSYKDGQVFLPLLKTGRFSESPLVALDANTGSVNWRITVPTGFYNSSAVIDGNRYITGIDNGQLLVINTVNGEILSSTNLGSEIRTPIVTNNSAYYVNAQSASGSNLIKFTINDNNEINVVYETALPNKSTSAAIIHNNRVYIGTQGKSFYVVNDLNGEIIREISYEAQFQGLTSSPLAVLDGETVHIYFMVNDNSGNVWHFEDNPSSTDNVEADVLYKVPSDLTQYTRNSMLMNVDGTIFFALDNGYYFAIRSTTPNNTEPTTEATTTTEPTTEATTEATTTSEPTTEETTQETTVEPTTEETAQETTVEPTTEATAQETTQEPSTEVTTSEPTSQKETVELIEAHELFNGVDALKVSTSGDLDTLEEVAINVDGERIVLTEDSYSAESGSTIITIPAETLNGLNLQDGQSYTIEIVHTENDNHNAAVIEHSFNVALASGSTTTEETTQETTTEPTAEETTTEPSSDESTTTHPAESATEPTTPAKDSSTDASNTTSTSSESIAATGESNNGLILVTLAMSFATILLVVRIYIKKKTEEN